jgi:type I restriction enzyme S subunit
MVGQSAQKREGSWVNAKIGSLAKLYQPQTIASSLFTDFGYPVYGANGLVGFYSRANHRTWQVTITCRGSTCGTVNRTVEECWITGNAMVINCDENQSLDKLFFYYLLTAQDFTNCITGTGQPQIVRTPLQEFEVFYPQSLKEQKRIALLLANIDTWINSQDALIAKKRDIMQQLLTGKTRLPGFSEQWKPMTLKSLGSFYGGLTGKSKVDFERGSGKYIPFVNVMANVQIDPDFLALVHVADAESQNLVRFGDLIFNGSSETPNEVGLCSAVNFESGKLFLNSFCFGFRPASLDLLDSLFFAYLFRSTVGRKIMFSLAQGSTRYNLSKTKLITKELLVPVKPEQCAIARVLSDMDSEIEALVARREKTALIKQGMMQELLTGRTRLA